MRVLVLGGSGMIGHRIWATLGKTHEVFGTLRRAELGALKDLSGIHSKQAFLNIDVTNEELLEKTINHCQPHFVINCVGIVKHVAISKNPIPTISLNSLFPHKLAQLCKKLNTRMIQFSTDCVFDGKEGMYKEEDPTNAIDLYGKSKALGEVVEQDHVTTIRTSTIGREVFPHGGLIEWFLSHKGQGIKGYKKAIFSGFPTHTLAKILDQHVLSNNSINGLLHVASLPIDKFSLLNLVNEELHAQVDVQPEDNFILNRSLNGNKFSELTGFKPIAWSDMIRDVSVDADFYNSLNRG